MLSTNINEITVSTIIETIKGLDETKRAEYEKFFKDSLKKFNARSVKTLSKDARKKFFKYIDDNWKEIEKEGKIEETSSSGAAPGYLTPNAFSNGSNAAKKKQKQNSELLGYELVNRDHYKEAVEKVETLLKESFYFKDENLTPEQKMNLAVRQIRNNLHEVEKLVSRTIRLKNESGIQSEEYGKRTYAALRKINEKIIRLMGSIQNFK
jgi:hypothetical protein